MSGEPPDSLCCQHCGGCTAPSSPRAGAASGYASTSGPKDGCVLVALLSGARRSLGCWSGPTSSNADGFPGPVPDPAERPPWRKLLYIKQNYPDNHVDVTFLEEMQKNVNVRSYKYWEVVCDTGVIVQQISSIVVFVAIFIYLYFEVLLPITLTTIGTTLTGAGYVFWDLSSRKADPSFEHKRKKVAKGALLFSLTLLGLSPILKTLTKDSSSDSIWALAVCLFLANLLFHDYRSSNRTNITWAVSGLSVVLVQNVPSAFRDLHSHAPRSLLAVLGHRFPGSFSLNAAIFASVLLASRLSSNMHVFSLLAFAVEWFALFPILRRHLKVAYRYFASYHVILTRCILSFPLFPDVIRQTQHCHDNHALRYDECAVFKHIQGRRNHILFHSRLHHPGLPRLANMDSEIQKRDPRTVGRSKAEAAEGLEGAR
ncbi:MAG: LOW QUALITY PROTEIN: phosphatidylinositol N-acetylglucosaminyltransferase-domain-containing protein [Olpidium bornovanus]|uniref:Phosphatidylinositol N-acetylglucosaminyltransferase-domain-containing protein n=1 Tax=Olpidium bornovanus TaxID=278681 RepID=A0A8H8DLJ0_9FUNG|nr:MAG: LOW QUALITY PROTEIN: phosphatidylinositol N-acetylglucosaminyltransferase-domain-containing protein [Olpidium bornovanus]